MCMCVNWLSICMQSSARISFRSVNVDYNCSGWRRPRSSRSSSEDRKSRQRTNDGNKLLKRTTNSIFNSTHCISPVYQRSFGKFSFTWSIEIDARKRFLNSRRRWCFHVLFFFSGRSDAWWRETSDCSSDWEAGSHQKIFRYVLRERRNSGCRQIRIVLYADTKKRQERVNSKSACDLKYEMSNEQTYFTSRNNFLDIAANVTNTSIRKKQTLKNVRARARVCVCDCKISHTCEII